MQSGIMRSSTIPELEFRVWHAWDQREKIEGYNLPGIYLIRITSAANVAGSPANLTDAAYIGMTNSLKGLKGRLEQFDKTIRGKADSHNPAKRIRKERGNYEWQDPLYVAAMSIECDTKTPEYDDYIKMGWVVYLEYVTLAKYHDVNKKLPQYNIKSKRPISDKED
jgi:hypothetical protein